MSNTNSSLLPDSSKLSLTKDDLFDRVINLKLITGEYKDGAVDIKHDEYVIRSDYEAVYKNLDVTKVMQTGNIPSQSYYIRKCQMKPSIKIQYKNVSQSTSIGIDIFISNFFMTDSKGQRLMSFNNETYPLKQVEIMAGYFGQFKNMPHSTWQDLQNFTPMFGVDKIVINVTYVTTDKLPPDSELHIHGYVGATPLASEVAEITDDTFDSIKAGTYVETVTSTTGNKSALENIFFQHITRRFLRTSVLDKKDVLKTTKGFMSITDAKKYGINVYCSKGVQELSKKCLEKKKVSQDGKEVDSKVYFNSGDSPENTLANILSLVNGKLIKKPLTDGNWIVYTEEESLDVDELKQRFIGTSGDYSKGTALVKTYDHVLPAVYNINIDSLATIVAPFFYFVNPFDFVYFNNRYAMSSQVAYFANRNATLNKFYVIQQTISFATVEDINEMTLICTADKDKDKDNK